MFYTYYQNNSYGVLHIDERVTRWVIIEADSATEANDRAEEVGLYFDGDFDCPCCGNRWEYFWESEKGDPMSSLYGDPICDLIDFANVPPEESKIYIYYKNGQKGTVRKA